MIPPPTLRIAEKPVTVLALHYRLKLSGQVTRWPPGYVYT